MTARERSIRVRLSERIQLHSDYASRVGIEVKRKAEEVASQASERKD